MGRLFTKIWIEVLMLLGNEGKFGCADMLNENNLVYMHGRKTDGRSVLHMHIILGYPCMKTRASS